MASLRGGTIVDGLFRGPTTCQGLGASVLGYEPTDEEEDEMRMAQELAWTMDKYRPPNAVFDVSSQPNLPEGGGMRRTASNVQPNAQTIPDVEEGGGTEAPSSELGEGDNAQRPSSESDDETGAAAVATIDEERRGDEALIELHLTSAGESTAHSPHGNSLAAQPSSTSTPASAHQAITKRALEEANRASTRHRDAHFVPYNHWTDDALHLLRHKDHQEKLFAASVAAATTTPSGRPPQPPGTMPCNFASLKYYDVQGSNHMRPQRRSDPPTTRLFHVQEDSICYAAGHHITTVGVFDKHHRHVLLKKEDAVGITCFLASQDGKYIAVAERLAEAPRVVIYRSDLFSEVLALSFQYVAKGSVMAMCMSSNNKYLVASCGPTEARLVLWQLDDCRVLATVEGSQAPLHGARIEALLYNPWLSQWMTTLQAQCLTLWHGDDKGKLSPKTAVDIDSILDKYGVLNDALYSALEDPPTLSRVTSFVQPSTKANTPASSTPQGAFPQGGKQISHRMRPPQLLSSHCWFDEDSVAVLTADGCVVTVEDGQLASLTRIYLPPSILLPAIAAVEQVVDPSKRGAEPAMSMSGAAAQQRLNRQASVLGPLSRVTSRGPETGSDGCEERTYFSHLVWVSRGILVAGPGACLILLDRTYDFRGFQQVAVLPCFHAAPTTSIIGLSVSPAEENVVVHLSTNAMEVAVLSEVDDVLNEFLEVLRGRRDTESIDDGSGKQLSALSNSMAHRRAKRVEEPSLLEESARVIGSESRLLLDKVRAAAVHRPYRAADGAGATDVSEATTAPRWQLKAQHDYEELETYHNVPLESLASGTFSNNGSDDGGGGAGGASAAAKDAGLSHHGILLKSGRGIFAPLAHVALHSDTITGIGVAKQLPFMVTSSADRSLVVYNFAARTVVAQRVYDEEILSCAIHPTGLYVVIALEFFAKCYMVLPEQQLFLKVADMDVRGCHEVAYSESGSRLAFTVGNKVVIYDANQYRPQGQLVGHTVMVKSVSWSNNDGRITTADMIGTICCWNTTTYLRDGLDASQNSLVIQTARFHPGTGLIAAIGSNKHATHSVFEGEFTVVCASPNNPFAVVLLRPGLILPKAMSSRKLHLQLIAFASVSQTLFVGTPTGRILMYAWPVLRTSKPYDYVDAHTSEVLHLVLSPDERFLFSVGSDHTMFTFHLEQSRNGKYIAASAFNYHIFDDLVFGLKSTMDAYARDAAALRMLAADYKQRHMASLEAIEKRETEALVTLRANRAIQMESLRKRLEVLKAEKSKIDKQSIQEGNAVEISYNGAAESLENLYTKVQEEAAMRYHQLEFERDEVTIRFESTMSKRMNEYQRELQELDGMRLDRERSLMNEIQRLESLEKKNSVTVDAVLCQTVVDYELELKDVERAQQAALRRNEEMVLRAMLAASVGDREVDRLKKDIGGLTTQLDGRKHTLKDLQQLLDRRHKETLELKQGMVAKQEAINVAERKMQQMKHQLSALENLRFVLTHQFETLEADVQPKDDAIVELEGAIGDVEKELCSADEQRTALRNKSLALKGVLQTLESERSALFNKSLTANRGLERMLNELSGVVAAFRDPLQLGVSLKKLLDAWSSKKQSMGNTDGGPKKKATTSESAAAKQRHAASTPLPTTSPERAGSSPNVDAKELLSRELAEIHERMVLSAKYATELPLRQHRLLATSNAGQMDENSAMIREAKELRAEKRSLSTRVLNNENSLRDVRAALHRLAIKNRMLMLTEASEPLAVTQHPDTALAPPSSLLETSVVSTSAQTPIPFDAPSPILGATPQTAAKKVPSTVRSKPSVTPTPSHAGVGRRTVLPPLGGAARPTGPPDATAAARSASAEPQLTTWGGQPLRRKPSSAERFKADQKDRLEQLLNQLNDDASKMQAHKHDINSLRQVAQELLRLEEQRLLRDLAKTTVPPSASSPAAGLGDDADVTAAAMMEAPDWVVRTGGGEGRQEQSDTDGARPMTPAKAV